MYNKQYSCQKYICLSKVKFIGRALNLHMKIDKILIISIFLALIPTLGLASKNKNQELNFWPNETKISTEIDENMLKMPVKIKINDETIDETLEEYLIGVAAAEISPTYHPEAIKAQIIAAHTYAINRYGPSGPYPADPSIFQAYLTKQQRRQKYQDNFEKYENILKSAVENVANKIVTYENLPIKAAFHSMSAGKTESSANVWGSDVPYLVEADSQFETSLKNFQTKISKNIVESFKKIKQKHPNATMPKNRQNSIKIISKTNAQYVKSAQIFGVELSGTQIRAALNLPSASFDVSVENNNFIFTCKGNGHGVGMSQCGANQLASGGKTCEEILKHYYKGVSIDLM